MNGRKESIAFLALGLMALLLFFPMVFLGKTFYLRDLTYIFHPWKTLCTQAVQSGELPLWNSYAYCGMPLLANWQTAVLYPFSQFFYLFSFTTALKAFHITQVLIAGYFAYLFGLRELKSRPAGLAMMVLFAFGGFFITKLEFLSYSGVVAWTFAPLLLRGRAVPLALALSFSFLGGHQVFAYQLFILLLFAARDLAERGRLPSDRLRYGGMLAFSGFLFLCLCAVQLLPTLELMSFSMRKKEGIDYSIAMLHSLDLSVLPGLISPYLARIKSGLVAGEYMQWDTTFYIGFAGSTLALLGLLRRSSGQRLTASILIISGCVLAMGEHTPVYPWLYKHIFIFHVTRYPVQLAYLAAAGAVILAGMGAKNSKYGLPLILLASAEMLVVAWGFQPTAADAYFDNKPELAALLQSEPLKNRFILSPGTEKNRFIKAASIEEGWQAARGRLYNLTCLPFRVPNAYGFGEPLTSESIENAVNKAYTIPEASKAVQAFASLGVSYLVCKDRLSDPSGYTLRTSSPVYVYSLNSSRGLCSFEPRPSPKDTFSCLQSFNARHFVFRNSSKSFFTWRECRDPGWILFVDGNKTEPGTADGLFPVFALKSGRTEAAYIYRPFSFSLGLGVTLVSVLLMLVLLWKNGGRYV